MILINIQLLLEVVNFGSITSVEQLSQQIAVVACMVTITYCNFVKLMEKKSLQKYMYTV